MHDRAFPEEFKGAFTPAQFEAVSLIIEDIIQNGSSRKKNADLVQSHGFADATIRDALMRAASLGVLTIELHNYRSIHLNEQSQLGQKIRDWVVRNRPSLTPHRDG